MATVEIKLQPFRPPNYVLVESPRKAREEGLVETPKFSLADLSAETLSDLCDQFRADVFEKAGKPDPKAA